MIYELQNCGITIKADTKGAELKSLVKNGVEYMWQADPAFWARTAPVLFPIVGSLKNKEYTDKGNVYSMGQHGFARDTEFEFVKKTEDSISFKLVDNEETRKKFPYAFSLFITHKIDESGVRTEWKVENTGDEIMNFSIGGHPAFNCKMQGYSYHIYEKKDDKLEAADKIGYYLLNSDGTVCENRLEKELGNAGELPISPELFENDALVCTESKVRKVAIANEQGEEYIAVSFDDACSIYGLWSPAGKNAPFVCIEPWYGTADYESTNGEWKDKKNSNSLNPGEIFVGGYSIEV